MNLEPLWAEASSVANFGANGLVVVPLLRLLPEDDVNALFIDNLKLKKYKISDDVPLFVQLLVYFTTKM